MHQRWRHPLFERSAPLSQGQRGAQQPAVDKKQSRIGNVILFNQRPYGGFQGLERASQGAGLAQRN